MIIIKTISLHVQYPYKATLKWSLLKVQWLIPHRIKHTLHTSYTMRLYIQVWIWKWGTEKIYYPAWYGHLHAKLYQLHVSAQCVSWCQWLGFSCQVHCISITLCWYIIGWYIGYHQNAIHTVAVLHVSPCHISRTRLRSISPSPQTVYSNPKCCPFGIKSFSQVPNIGPSLAYCNTALLKFKATDTLAIDC